MNRNSSYLLAVLWDKPQFNPGIQRIRGGIGAQGVDIGNQSPISVLSLCGMPACAWPKDALSAFFYGE